MTFSVYIFLSSKFNSVIYDQCKQCVILFSAKSLKALRPACNAKKVAGLGGSKCYTGYGKGKGGGSLQTLFTSPNGKRAYHRYIHVLLLFSQFESFLLTPIVKCFTSNTTKQMKCYSIRIQGMLFLPGERSRGWTRKQRVDESHTFHLSQISAIPCTCLSQCLDS